MSTPFAPESAPEVGGAEAQPNAGAPEGAAPGAEGQQPQAPAGADPRVLEQMQSQLQQFGGVVGQVAEYLPAMQQLAERQGGGQQEPSLEDQFATFFGAGDDQNAGYDEYGRPQQGQPRFDAYTGEPLQQQRFDPFTGEPLQQTTPQVGGFQGDPGQFVQLMGQMIDDRLAPLQQQESQRQWDSLYEEFPQMNDPEHAPQIAGVVAQAARLFAGGDDRAARRLADDPRFARMAYLASVNQQRGEGETPAGAGDNGTTPIEQGANTSVTPPVEGDRGDAIVNAGRAEGGSAGSYFR